MPIIQGLSDLLNDIATWTIGLAVPVSAFVAVRAGLKYSQAEDPHEAKDAVDRFKKLIIGIAITASAPWVASQILSYF